MKRAALTVIAGLALVVACSSIDDYAGGQPPTAFAGRVSGTSSSASSSTSTGGSSNGDPRASVCPDQPLCGDEGCCPPSWRCIFSSCVAPGITCRSDDDCSEGRFCALVLAEPRCYPRPNWCPDDGVIRACPSGTCRNGPDLALGVAEATCSEVKLYVSNEGRESLPSGTAIAIDLDLAASEEGLDAGDAGHGDAGDAGDAGRGDAGRGVPDRTIVGYTTDGLLPGELAVMTIPAMIPVRAAVSARVAGDAGVGSCGEDNDFTLVYNGCRTPK